MKTFIHNFVTPPPKLEQITEANGDRVYATPSGAKYMSVTTLLKQLPNDGLEQWRRRVGPLQAARISKLATDRGSALHASAEAYLRNQTLMINDPMKRALFNKIVPYLNKIDQIRLIESALYSDKLKLAGTPDCIGEYDGVLSVIDFKTSTRIKDEKYIDSYYMQMAAYAYMFEHHYGILPTQGVIIMAVDESATGQLFIKPTSECFALLMQYVRDVNSYRDSEYANPLLQEGE